MHKEAEINRLFASLVLEAEANCHV